ncbi:hypothetical protein [Holophaga foetida]|uniref:hypothetical protein n=1 Tax=Holophaga foetida TaxID=35839 RepID=UPI0011DD5D18|nr:hypothetical protein [Holophaga foetida]
MNEKVVAGQFESEMAHLIAANLASGAVLDVDLVRILYAKVVAVLLLSASPADELHVEDIFSVLSKNEANLRSLEVELMEKVIFDLIYMH